jgi:hypothetical protein
MKIMKDYDQPTTPKVDMQKLPKPQMHNPNAVAAVDDANKVIPHATLVIDKE